MCWPCAGAIQRGDQYGPGWVGDAFVPESAGAAVAHFTVERSGTELRAEHRLYDDPDWGQREFLASSDERFRPVDADFGPDGAIWIIDMYRGVIEAIDALEYVDDGSVIPDLERLLNHPDEEVREAALDAIEYIEE